MLVPCNCESRLVRELPEQKVQAEIQRHFNFKGTKHLPWKQEP
jgi:hypothetical protein